MMRAIMCWLCIIGGLVVAVVALNTSKTKTFTIICYTVSLGLVVNGVWHLLSLIDGTEPSPSPTLSSRVTEAPAPAPTEDPFDAYYDELANNIAAFSFKITIPSKNATFSEDETYKRYAQGTYGQGVPLLDTYGGSRISLLNEGTEMVVLALQEGCAFVRVEDGRYGWVAAAKIAASFDAELSHQRKVNYVINDSNYWTAEGWREWIMANASDFPDYVVEAARNG